MLYFLTFWNPAVVDVIKVICVEDVQWSTASKRATIQNGGVRRQPIVDHQ
jgi:hypothetical protein